MDDAVVRAMTRWPDVPDVYGWLSLDRRGQWRLQGGTIGNRGLRSFISRNYLQTPQGAYIFQNGPQRVFVSLEYTPWVASLDGTQQLRLHTGDLLPHFEHAWMDEHGAVMLSTGHGPALVDDRDLEILTARMYSATGQRLDDEGQALAVDILLQGIDEHLKLEWQGCRVPLSPVRSESIPHAFAFVQAPQAPT